jgi:hypothetical protein
MVSPLYRSGAHPLAPGPQIGAFSAPSLYSKLTYPLLPRPVGQDASLRSRTLVAGLSPILNSSSSVSDATWGQAAQATFTKSPGPRSETRAA